MKILKVIFFLFLAVVLICALFVYGIFYTRQGAGFVTRKALDQYFKSENFVLGEVHGSLGQKVHYENIEMTDLEGFPKGSILRIQSCSFEITSLNLNGVKIYVENARLKMPYSDPIVLRGTLEDGMIKANVYSKSVDVKEVISLHPNPQKLKLLSGRLTNLDLYIEGNWQNPRVTGTAFVDTLTRREYSLVAAPVTVDLELHNFPKEIKRKGEISIESGTLDTSKTLVTLTPSKITFSLIPETISFDINGHAKVDKTKIDIALRGTRAKPELSLSSDPALPEAQLLLMVATGKGWDSAGQAMEQGQLSTALVGEMVGFFMFSGESEPSALSEIMSDVSVKFEDGVRGIGVKTDLTDSAEIGYGIEEAEDTTTTGKIITQKLEGAYNITDNISIDLERQLKQEYDNTPVQTAPKEPVADDKIYLKYKTKF